MNDFLSNMLRNLVKKKEKQFETYQDLWNSGLKPYVEKGYEIRIEPNVNDDLWKIYKTLSFKNIEDCLKILTDYKNV